MSICSVTLTIEVDDALLAEHPGATKPPPNALEGWTALDLFRAYELDLFDPLDFTLTREADGDLSSHHEVPGALADPIPPASAARRQAAVRAELEAADLYEAADAEDRDRMIDRAASLVGHSVTDSFGSRWPVMEVGVYKGRPMIRGVHYWDRAEAVIDHGEAISAEQAVQTLREVLEEEDDVIKAVERLLPRVQPCAASAQAVALCPQCTSEDVRRVGVSKVLAWRCGNCGVSFEAPLQEGA